MEYSTCETTSRWENGINWGGGIKENLLNFVSVAGIYVVANFRLLIPKNYAFNRLVCRLVHSYNIIQFSNLRLRCLLQIGTKYAFGPHRYINLWHIPSISNRRLLKRRVKSTLVQALRLCTGRTAFHDHGTRRGWEVRITPRPQFTPGKTRYLLYRRLGGPQVRSREERKISPPSAFDPGTLQPVDNRCTHYVNQPKQTFKPHRYISLWYIFSAPTGFWVT
jgi:hypothetical protein